MQVLNKKFKPYRLSKINKTKKSHKHRTESSKCRDGDGKLKMGNLNCQSVAFGRKQALLFGIHLRKHSLQL